MYKIENGFFVKGDLKTKTIHGDKTISEDWEIKQKNSIEEYNLTHDNNYPEYINYIFRIYGWVINSTILSKISNNNQINVLDVGCGISKKTPPYFNCNNNQVNYIGLDPININSNRDFLFINSVIEKIDELIPPNSIDIFCFSTSLDHIQDLNILVEKLKIVANKNAKVVMVQSVRDSNIYANKLMYYHLDSMNNISFTGFKNKLKYINRIKLFILNLFKERKKIEVLEKKIKSSQSLDDLHFHFFTRETLRNFLLNKIGKSCVEKLILPYQVLLTVNNID
jgi:ubiquinone/menaquinone biosynthesis C-methylase UbiE